MTTLIANRYQVLEEIGAGGMGIVYCVVDRLTQQRVALKRVTTANNNLVFLSRSTNENFRIAIAQEFKVLSSLRHPNIISVLDYGFDADQAPYFTMTYLENVQSILDAGRNLDLAGKLRLVVHALNALLYLHRNKILHRDLKPGNMLVDDKLKLTLLDFGLSVKADETNSAGTLMYMAPEVLQQFSATKVSDLYSLGIVAYELLTGNLPFDPSNPSRLIIQTMDMVPDVSCIEDCNLRSIMTRWLSKEPGDRPQSAQALIDLLTPYLQGVPPAASPEIRESFLQSARFVGREEEFTRLTGALIKAKDGKGSGWLIGGESGVGKSRLMDELRTIAQVEGATVIRTFGVQGAGLSFQLWRDVIARLILNVDVSSIEAGILAEVAPEIENILEGQEIAQVPEVNAALARDRIIQTIVDLIKRQPGLTVILLEDLHWAGDSLAIIEKLLDIIDSLPLLIVGNFRNDEQPGLPERLAGMELISLERFDRALIEELSATMLDDVGKLSDIVSLLHKETEGNAFFIVEVMRALAEDAGGLDRIGATTLPEHIITGGMLDLIQHRLNRIPEHMLSVLKLSAVIGREVSPALLAEIETPERVEAWITACVNNAILEFRDDRLSFAHDKLREIIHDHLSSDEIRRYNEQAAEVIEAHYPDTPAYAAVLSRHWSHAGNEPKATHYAKIACENVAALANHADTLRYGELALMGETLPKQERVRVMCKMGEALYYTGQPDDAQRTIQSARDLAEEIGYNDGVSDSLHGMALIAAGKADFESYETLVRASIEFAQSTKALAYGNLFLGAVHRIKEDHETSNSYIRIALGLFREIDDKYAIMGILNDRSVLENQLGDFEAAQRHILECLELAHQIGNQRSICVVLCNIAFIGFSLGNYDESLTHAQEAVRLAENINDRQSIVTATNRLGQSYAHRGDFEEAKSHLTHCVSLAESLGRLDIMIPSMTTITLVALAEGDFETAKSYVDQLEGRQEGVRTWLRSIIQLTIGNYYALRNSYKEAIIRYEDSLQVIKDKQEPWRTAQTKTKFAHVLSHMGDVEGARSLAMEALKELNAISSVPYLLDALLALSHVHHLDGDTWTAAQWVGVIANHPALSSIETEPWIGPLADEYARSLGLEAFEEAMNLGESLDLLEVVTSLI